MPAHDYDSITVYCRACGIARQTASQYNLECLATPNVVGISHLLAVKRAKAVLGLQDDPLAVTAPCDA